MKKTAVLYIAVALIAAVAAGVAFLVLGAAVTVDYNGKTYTMTELNEGFVETTYAYQAEDGTAVTGKTCVDCGCFVVTHSTDGSTVTGKVSREGYNYSELPAENACGHEESETFTHGDAYLFTRQVYTARTRRQNAGTVWLYIGLSLVIGLGGVYFLDPNHKTRFSRSWLGKALLVGAGLLLVTTLFDLIMM